MVRLVGLFCAMALATLAVVACGGSDNGSSTAQTSNGGATRVEMGDFSYMPGALTARPGETIAVMVVNTGNLPHNFTIDGVVESGNLNSRSSKTIEFSVPQASTLTFYCTIHGRATMSGTLTVSTSGAQTNPPPPAPTAAAGGGSSDEYYDTNY